MSVFPPHASKPTSKQLLAKLLLVATETEVATIGTRNV